MERNIKSLGSGEIKMIYLNSSNVLYSVGIEDPTIEGSYGGFISQGRLILRPEWRDHLDIVACLASNSVYNHLTKQNQVQLNVSFPPHFIGFQPGDSHTIVEGRPNCQYSSLQPIFQERFKIKLEKVYLFGSKGKHVW